MKKQMGGSNKNNRHSIINKAISESSNSTVFPPKNLPFPAPETTCLSHESLPFGCSLDPSGAAKISKDQKNTRKIRV